MFENLITNTIMEMLSERLTSNDNQIEFLQKVDAKRIIQQILLVLKKFDTANSNPEFISKLRSTFEECEKYCIE